MTGLRGSDLVALPAGTRVGSYEIVGPLGAGGMDPERDELGPGADGRPEGLRYVEHDAMTSLRNRT